MSSTTSKAEWNGVEEKVLVEAVHEDHDELTCDDEQAALKQLMRAIAEIDLFVVSNDGVPKMFDRALKNAMEIIPAFKETFFESLNQTELEEDRDFHPVEILGNRLGIFLAEWLQGREEIKRRLGLDRKRRRDMVEMTFLVKRSLWQEVVDTQGFPERVPELQVDHALRLLVEEQKKDLAREKARKAQ